MAQVTIEIDILPDGTPKPTPNPATVADGDTVQWHVNSNTKGGGNLNVTLPSGAGSPFGNQAADIAIEVEQPVFCNVLKPSPNPIHWPDGVDSYRYRVEFHNSPGLVAANLYLFSSAAHQLAGGYRAISVGGAGVMAVSTSGEAIWHPADASQPKQNCCSCCSCGGGKDDSQIPTGAAGTASIQLAAPATRSRLLLGLVEVWTVALHWSATPPAVGVTVKVMYPWPASPPPGPDGFNILARNQPLVGSYLHTFQAPAGALPTSGPSGFVYRVEATDAAGHVVAVNQAPWFV